MVGVKVRKVRRQNTQRVGVVAGGLRNSVAEPGFSWGEGRCSNFGQMFMKPLKLKAVYQQVPWSFILYFWWTFRVFGVVGGGEGSVVAGFNFPAFNLRSRTFINCAQSPIRCRTSLNHTQINRASLPMFAFNALSVNVIVLSSV